ncbi:MAG TPA: response regulator transcription factor [Acetobacteraceae bacterium]|nr:response regulator transcription factor [Acetobacteraceae bacterium]
MDTSLPKRDEPGAARAARTLLIVEDDPSFARALGRSFERRGYRVALCDRADAVAEALAAMSPSFAVVDLKLVGPSGLECVKMLHAHDPAMKIVVLTGFASIATAVEAIKLGACYYLAKPSNADDIEAAFEREAGDAGVALSPRPSSIKTLEWEHIHETLVETDFNISEAARRLGMHRRTLARKLLKRRVD